MGYKGQTYYKASQIASNSHWGISANSSTLQTNLGGLGGRCYILPGKPWQAVDHPDLEGQV